MERMQKAGEKASLEFGTDGYVSDLKIDMSKVDLDDEQKEIFEEKKQQLIENMNKLLTITQTADASEEVKMDVLNKVLENYQVKLSKDDEGWALDGAGLGVVIFEPMMISPTIVMDMIVPFISLKFGKVERKCQPTADSCKVLDIMMRKAEDSKDSVLLSNNKSINLDEIRAKIESDQLMENVKINTAIFKDPAVNASYKNGEVSFYGESPIVKEAIAIV